jgi:hypothetical protein
LPQSILASNFTGFQQALLDIFPEFIQSFKFAYFLGEFIIQFPHLFALNTFNRNLEYSSLPR